MCGSQVKAENAGRTHTQAGLLPEEHSTAADWQTQKDRREAGCRCINKSRRLCFAGEPLLAPQPTGHPRPFEVFTGTDMPWPFAVFIRMAGKVIASKIPDIYDSVLMDGAAEITWQSSVDRYSA